MSWALMKQSEESTEHPGGDARQATVLLRAIQQQNPRDAIEPKLGGQCWEEFQSYQDVVP